MFFRKMERISINFFSAFHTLKWGEFRCLSAPLASVYFSSGILLALEILIIMLNVVYTSLSKAIFCPISCF